jgi:3',5'-nucleoside bisphosphate phosphatase
LSRIDLHTHSTASDGSFSPTDLLLAAVESGIEVLSLTDHDTFDGLGEALDAGQRLGLRVIPGVELSVDYEDGSLHLLGYGFDRYNLLFREAIAKLVESRLERNRSIIERLNQLGYRITFEETLTRSSRGTMGRAHIAQVLVETGQLVSFDEAFERLLGRGKAAYVDRWRLSLTEACGLIHQAGGAAVWAHPGLHGSKLPILQERLPKWSKEGLDGLESDYSNHSTELRDQLRLTATRNGLIFTGGSDFHGALRPAVKMGDGPGGEAIADECLRNLDHRLAVLRGRV